MSFAPPSDPILIQEYPYGLKRNEFIFPIRNSETPFTYPLIPLRVDQKINSLKLYFKKKSDLPTRYVFAGFSPQPDE
jgi:hypothetical protein